MRVKNDEVRQSILDAAKNEFFVKGYQDANMRSIAEKANITPGNIYRYFASKEELLEAIVGSIDRAISKITKLETVFPSELIPNSRALFSWAVNNALDIAIKHKFEAIVLLKKSQGSKYEHAGDKFIEFTANSIDKTRKTSNMELSRIMARVVIYTEIDILEEYIDDEDKIRELSLLFLEAFFAGFTA